MPETPDPLRAAIRAELMHPSSPVTSADQADAFVERLATRLMAFEKDERYELAERVVCAVRNELWDPQPKIAAIKESAKEDAGARTRSGHPVDVLVELAEDLGYDLDGDQVEALREQCDSPVDEGLERLVTIWASDLIAAQDEGRWSRATLRSALLAFRTECLAAIGLDESGAPAPPCDFCQSKDHGANDCPHDAEDREMPDDRFEDEPSLVLRVHNLAKRLDESARSLRNEEREAPGPRAHGLAGVFEAMAQELRVGGLYGPYTDGDGVIPEKDTRPLVVIESPYAGDTEANLTYARRAMDDSLERGENPIASHLLYTQPGILNDADPEERQRGIDAGLAWGAHADAIAFYTDRGMSPGMRRAEEYWRSRGKQIVYRSMD